MALQAHDVHTNGRIKQFTVKEAEALFDSRARQHLSISGKDFIKRWKSGFYDQQTEDSHVMAVAMLLPLVDEDIGR